VLDGVRNKAPDIAPLDLNTVIADWILRYLWLGRQILEESARYCSRYPEFWREFYSLSRLL